MERLTNRIFGPIEKRDVVVFTQGEFIDTVPAEMTYEDIRKVLRKLAEYEDLDEQGLLLRLPCKVGDRLYKIDYEYLGNIISDTVHSIHILRNTVYLEMKYWHDISLSEVGKTTFLTQAEAEQKLKEMESD